MTRLSDSEQVIRKLYEITNHHNWGFKDQVNELLKMGLERFDLDIGILSKIDGEVYTVQYCVTPPDIELKPGDQFSFDLTYCKITCSSNKPVMLDHAAEDDEFAHHPAYKSLGLESYIGVPIRLGGVLYGTLNFSSPAPHQGKFKDSDVDTLKLMASWIEVELIRREQEKIIKESNVELSKALKEIQDKQKQIIDVENLKSVRELAATVAHEFGQPLQALSSTIELLKDGGDIKKLIPIFDQTVKRFVHLTDNLRNITSLSKKEYLDTNILDLDASSTIYSSSILIVDDDLLVLELLVDMLKLKGFDCDGAASGKQALELIKKKDYKYIISDVAMPEMSGPELFNKLRSQGNSTTFIFITGYEITHEFENVIRKADGLLNKPVSFDDLFKLMQKLSA